MDETWRYFSWRTVDFDDLETQLDQSLCTEYRHFRRNLSEVDSYDADDRLYTKAWAEQLAGVLARWCSHLEVEPSATSVFAQTQARMFTHGWSLELDPAGTATEIVGALRAKSQDPRAIYRPLCLERADREIMKWLKARPERVDRVHHRSFEVILAEVIREKGWQVELTKQTRDGGYDLMCMRADALGFPVAMIVEAKLYDLKRPVGLPMVDRLMGVASREAVQRAVLVTNSRFSATAWTEWEHRVGRDLELVDREELFEWLRAYRLVEETRS